MPKKKQQKNGFSMYMEEVFERLKSEGKKIAFKDVAPIASPEWEALTPEKKAEYNQRAKEWKAQMKETLEGKVDCVGKLIKETMQIKEDLENEKLAMHRNIKEMLNIKDIAKKNFYIISFNTFCLTDTGEHVPAEMGLVEYSIERGIFRTYHEFIHPGSIPFGYSYTCLQNSEMTHKIPLPESRFNKTHESPSKFKGFNDNYVSILAHIKGFLKMEETDSDELIVFCYPGEDEDRHEERQKTQYLLEWLQRKSGDRSNVTFKTYDLVRLFYELRFAAGIQKDSSSICKDILKKNVFDYVPNISCKWHEDIDSPKYCSLGIVKRMCFLMSDYLCRPYNVKMIPHQHVPVREERSDFSIVNPSDYKIDVRPIKNVVNVPQKPIVESPITTIVPEKSKFSRPETVFIPSAQAVGNIKMPAAPEKRSATNPWNLNSTNQPFSQNAGTAAQLFHEKSSDFCLESEDFPSLGASPRLMPGRGTAIRSRGRINTVLRGLGRGDPKDS